jgi:hypothetical protein
MQIYHAGVAAHLFKGSRDGTNEHRSYSDSNGIPFRACGLLLEGYTLHRARPWGAPAACLYVAAVQGGDVHIAVAPRGGVLHPPWHYGSLSMRCLSTG